MSGESIGDNVGDAGFVDDGEVVFGEEVKPMGVAGGQVGLGLNVADCPIVAVNREVAAEVVAPNLEGLKGGEEF